MKIIKTAKWKEQLKGGLAKGKNPSDFNQKKLQEGIKVEKEHSTDEKISTEIAMDHLTENPNYYKKLKKIEEK